MLIVGWSNKQQQWNVRQLVFIDESALNERIGDHCYGWGPIGLPVRVKRWLKKLERWSVLLAYTLSGYKRPLMFKGAITAEIFKHWLNINLLPLIDRPKGMQLIIIIDNCRIHKSP